MSEVSDMIQQHACHYCGVKALEMLRIDTKKETPEPVVHCRNCGREGLLADGATSWEAWQIWNAPLWLLKLFKAIKK